MDIDLLFPQFDNGEQIKYPRSCRKNFLNAAKITEWFLFLLSVSNFEIRNKNTIANIKDC